MLTICRVATPLLPFVDSLITSDIFSAVWGMLFQQIFLSTIAFTPLTHGRLHIHKQSEGLLDSWSKATEVIGSEGGREVRAAEESEEQEKGGTDKGWLNDVHVLYVCVLYIQMSLNIQATRQKLVFRNLGWSP